MSTESPLTMDSRELSFDDLNAPLAEASPLGGAGPFVINLGASSAPMELPAEDLTSGSPTYVYRIRRNEDGRVRYRLRLGPFVREEDADAALSRVRNVYPGALTATAWVEDLNAISVQQAKAGVSRPFMESVPKLRSVPDVSRVAPISSVPDIGSAPVVPTLEEPVAAPAASMAAAPPIENTPVESIAVVEPVVPAVDVIPIAAEPAGEEIDIDDAEPTMEALALTELALAPEGEAPAPALSRTSFGSSRAPDDAPTQSMPGPALEFPELLLLDEAPASAVRSRPVEGTVASPAATGKLPVLDASFDALSASISLEEPAPKAMAAPPVAKPVSVQAAAISRTPISPPPISPPPVQSMARPAAASPVSVARAAIPAREAPLSLESTQTLRPLTSSEMRDEVALRWFVVQLSSSDQAFDPSTVPNLDIFLLYRLYSVTSVDQGRPVHTLRLGFFGEEMAAHAVASYLKSYYESSTVKRVSVAERERFSEHRLDARKDVGETGQHAAIELSTERPAAKVEIPAPKPAQPKSLQPTAAVRAAALRQISGQQPKKEKPAGVFASLPWIGRRK
jgi:hypothetical protein